jgi:hypothetical protein
MNAKTIILLILVVSGSHVSSNRELRPNANGLGLADGNSRLPAGNLVRLGTFDIPDLNIQAHQSEFTYLNSQFTGYGTVPIGQGFGSKQVTSQQRLGTNNRDRILSGNRFTPAFDNPTASLAQWHFT